ncbi:cysteine-rich receptor-like protein kinase 26 isoform X2 [Momordica charantia]|uniref:Cysteine-rich receptor-like protein kinase 26 isoform X2 n=1 Tax=Momordica charantia TaxID=3673 RepID=A0A6J1DDL6_MOMCH|nr:cysteine-rich receptor-like protein kinase 26 isoform X2 [Momordica charantia]
MVSFRRLFFILTHLIFIFITTTSQPDFFLSKCSDKSDDSNNSSSRFHQNLRNALASISSKSSTQITNYGFYNASFGNDPDPANAKALCRGGAPLELCQTCVNNSAHRILQDCPSQKEGTGWYDDCQIVYSNNSLHGDVSVAGLTTQIYYNLETAPDVDGFNAALTELLIGLRERAAAGNSTRKSAGGDVKLPSPNFYTIYGLVDCFPDMSLVDCDVCLSGLMSSLPNGSIGAKSVVTSCQIGYEIHPIYDSLLSPPPPPTPTRPPPLPDVLSPSSPPIKGDNNKATRNVVIIVVAWTLSVSIIIIFIVLIILRKRRKLKQKTERTLNRGEATDEISSIEMLQFNFETIKLGTNEFSNENKLGQGGFGVVYKGKLPNGQHIAVKRQLENNSQEGNVEFKNEVLLMAKLQHRNLVRLLGFCLHKNERLLIYEFVPNGSLDHFIFDFGKKILLDWGKRYKIIIGIARGLLYLHEDSHLRIIHRDLKASNILLDEELNPKIADFGTARLFEVDETQRNTNRVVGTYGYMAPEYIIQGQFSVKSDVFSFGVLVLEILSGRKNTRFRTEDSNEEDLLSFAWKNWSAGTITNVIDSTLTAGSRIEMIRCIHIGLLCVQENTTERPTIASVILMLSSFSFTLLRPSKPAFLMYSNVDGSNVLSNRSRLVTNQSDHSECIPLQISRNETSISEIYPR